MPDLQAVNIDPKEAACPASSTRRASPSAPQSPEFLGTVAQGNPWQFQHYVRFGYAGGPVMPAFNERGWTMQNIMDVLAYVQTLPVD